MRHPHSPPALAHQPRAIRYCSRNSGLPRVVAVGWWPAQLMLSRTQRPAGAQWLPWLERLLTDSQGACVLWVFQSSHSCPGFAGLSSDSTQLGFPGKGPKQSPPPTYPHLLPASNFSLLCKARCKVAMGLISQDHEDMPSSACSLSVLAPPTLGDQNL